MKRALTYISIGLISFCLGWFFNETWRFAEAMKNDIAPDTLKFRLAIDKFENNNKGKTENIKDSLTAFCQIQEMNNPEKFPTLTNKLFVDTLNNKPIAFYLNHPNIDKYSKLYYKGKFAASDDDMTFAFLDSVLTTNPETKAFYLYVFNCVLRTSDGALSEYISEDCRKYFEQFPCEFLLLKNSKLYSQNYEEWINFTAFDYYVEQNSIEILDKVIKKIKPKVLTNCGNHDNEIESIRMKMIKLIKENK